MHFDPETIDLARQLHLSGLDWQPEDGDPFLVTAELPLDLPVGRIAVFHSAWIDGEALVDRVLWLPTWDRARAWLAERGFHQMTHYSELGKADIKVWPTRENMSPVYAGHAQSSLAALFQILVQAVRDASCEP